MKKIQKKVLLVLTVLVIGFMFNIENVSAAEVCSYFTEEAYFANVKNTKITLIYENSEFKATCSDEIKTFWQPSLGCYINDSNISSLFVVENGTLYCPSKIYANAENITINKYTGRTEYTLATKPRLNSEGGPQYLLLESPTVSGTAKVYVPETSGSTFIPCKQGGYNKAISITEKAVQTVKEMRAISDTDFTQEEFDKYSGLLNSYQNQLDDTAKKYCDSEDALKVLGKLPPVMEELNKKQIASEKIDDNQKSENSGTVDNITNDIFSSLAKYDEISVPMNPNKTYTCEQLLDEDLKIVIQKILLWVRIITPILLIILGAVDFGTAVISQDQDALKKATSKFVKRAIAAVAVFFIPLLVSVILNMPGIGTSADPNCGIS